jgi:hypothetical protein
LGVSESWYGAEKCFLSPYYQNTKLSYKTRQICLGILVGKWFGIRGHYFGGEGGGLTVFATYSRQPKDTEIAVDCLVDDGAV